MKISHGWCHEGWGRFAGCDLLRPGSGNGEELMESRSGKSERRPRGDGPERWEPESDDERDPHKTCVLWGKAKSSIFSALSSLLIQEGPPPKAPGWCILFLNQGIPSASRPESAPDVREEVQRADLPKITTSKKQGQERDPVLVLSLSPFPSAVSFSEHSPFARHKIHCFQA